MQCSSPVRLSFTLTLFRYDHCSSLSSPSITINVFSLPCAVAQAYCSAWDASKEALFLFEAHVCSICGIGFRTHAAFVGHISTSRLHKERQRQRNLWRAMPPRRGSIQLSISSGSVAHGDDVDDDDDDDDDDYDVVSVGFCFEKNTLQFI